MVIGLTGGIGSGKSTVAKIVERLGVPVFYADDEAKKFLWNNEVKSQLAAIFGKNIIGADGEIHKPSLAKIVFSDERSLALLNNLIHPLLLAAFKNWVVNNSSNKNNYLLMEAAILFEAGFDIVVDKTVTVSANIEDRIQRVMQRDKESREQVMARINSQWSDRQREQKADFVIHNSNKDMILKRVVDLHKRWSQH